MRLVETIAKYEGIELREFCSRSENLNPPLSPAFSARAALGLPDRDSGHCTLGVRGILLSSVATRYQLGLVLHAGSLIAPLNHTTPDGTWESVQNAVFSGSSSAA
jgi:hypothetical protein